MAHPISITDYHDRRLEIRLRSKCSGCDRYPGVVHLLKTENVCPSLVSLEDCHPTCHPRGTSWLETKKKNMLCSLTMAATATAPCATLSSLFSCTLSCWFLRQEKIHRRIALIKQAEGLIRRELPPSIPLLCSTPFVGPLSRRDQFLRSQGFFTSFEYSPAPKVLEC